MNTLHQAIVLDAENPWTSQDPRAIVIPTSVPVGAFILVGIILRSGTVTVTSVACTSESNLTRLGTAFVNTVASSAESIHFFRLDSVANAGSKTITMDFSTFVNGVAFVAVLSPGVVDTANLVDGVGSTGTGTAVSDGITTASANSSIFMLASLGGSDGAVGTGLDTQIPLGNLFNWNDAGYILDSGAAGAKTPTITQTSGAWAAYSVAIATLQIDRDVEGYRWRDDDGSETSASWLASQDTNITRATSLNTRLRTLVNVTGDAPSEQYRLDYRLSTDTDYFTVEANGGGSLAYGAIGTVTTSGTTAPTVAYPSGITRGDLLLMTIANRPNANTPSTPSGWTAPSNNTTTGGAGSEAAGTGTVRMTVFYRVADGTESGSVTLAITSGTSCGASILRCSRTTGKDWAVACAIGSDNSAGTSVSVTFGSDPGVLAGDLVFVAYANSEDTATFASQALSQTGMTYGTMDERADSAITTGNDLRLVVTQHAVTSGTSSAAAVWTATASGTNAANSAGAAVMIRLRQVDAAIQLSPSANVTASGEATTVQLTAPSGKSTSDFVAGRLQDDENPADAVNITADDYTELEWCMTATANAVNGGVYQFRVTANGTVFSAYTTTPQWTIGSGSGGGSLLGNLIGGSLLGGILVR